ncbi:MAG TPA: tetratricopeptide repeat protein [Candidatus Cloacimonadota bacterium]|nr:tetratricopeptide repeat protein [Candidatus Cloacimonadota bacterium]HQB41922.1 tetratricopeptide repeat protein [Candidatus Cloacimonadota bacterium]
MESAYLKIKEFLNNVRQNTQKDKNDNKAKCVEFLTRIENEQPNKWHLLLNLCLLRMSDKEDIEVLKRISEEIEQSLGSKELTAQMYMTFADIYNLYNENNAALAYYKKCLTLLSELNNNIEFTRTEFSLAVVYVKLGMHFDAFELFVKLIEDPVIKEDSGRMTIAYKWLAIIEKDLHIFEESINKCVLMSRLSLKANDHYRYAEAQNLLGLNYNYLNKYEQALDAFQKCFEICTQYSFTDLLARTTRNIGKAYKSMEAFGQAEDYYLQSIRYEIKIKDFKHLSNKYLELGDIYIQKQSYEQARDTLLKAMSLSKAHKLDNLQTGFLSFAKLLKEQKKFNTSQSIVQRMLANKDNLSDRNSALAYGLLECISIEQKDFCEAFKYALLKNESLDKLKQLESAKKISHLKGSLALEQIKKDVRKRLIKQKQKTALERAVKTNRKLRKPANEINRNLEEIIDKLRSNEQIALFEKNILRMRKSIAKINETLDTFEKNKNIIFTDYLPSSEMVEFLD